MCWTPLHKTNSLWTRRNADFSFGRSSFVGTSLETVVDVPPPANSKRSKNGNTPKTISELRAFSGFTNFYATYIKDYAMLAARLQEKLKVPRSEGKKGSRKPITWDNDDQKAFDAIKAQLCSELSLQRVNPDKPFVLRVDASKYAVGAVLEQLPDGN